MVYAVKKQFATITIVIVCDLSSDLALVVILPSAERGCGDRRCRTRVCSCQELQQRRLSAALFAGDANDGLQIHFQVHRCSNHPEEGNPYTFARTEVGEPEVQRIVKPFGSGQDSSNSNKQ